MYKKKVGGILLFYNSDIYFHNCEYISELQDIKCNSTILIINVRIEIKCGKYLSLFFILWPQENKQTNSQKKLICYINYFNNALINTN